VLGGGKWSALCPSCYTPRERAPSTHFIGGLIGPRAGLDMVAKRQNLCPLPEIEPQASSP